MRCGWKKSDWEHRGLSGKRSKVVALGIEGKALGLPCRVTEVFLGENKPREGCLK